MCAVSEHNCLEALCANSQHRTPFRPQSLPPQWASREAFVAGELAAFKIGPSGSSS